MSDAVETATDTGVREVVIVGSGPAGYTAAVYAARANLHPVLFEGSVTAGGALMNTTDLKARGSMQRYIGSTSWVRMWQTTCAT